MNNTLKFNEWLEAQNKNIQSDLLLEVENIMNKINKEFDPYFEIYKNIKTNKISYKEGIEVLRLKLSELNGQQLGELNELSKMYSRTNCSWQYYQVAQIVHYIIMELFNGEDYTKSILYELKK